MGSTRHDELPMSRRFTNALNVGQKYRVRYRLAGQRVEHEFVGKYLGWVANGTERMTDWSLRPAAGTTRLAEWTLTATFPTNEECKVPRRVPA